jgi:hypothetical protein
MIGQYKRNQIPSNPFAIFLLCIFLSAWSLAQTNQTQSKSSKKQSLSFEDELIEGNTKKPELFYLFQKKNFNYKKLIRMRENFLPEMKKTTDDIQRSRVQK